MSDGDGHPSGSRGTASEPDPPLEFLCERCTTAFDKDHDFCPRCDGPKPSEGWRETRNYPDVWLGRLVCDRYRLLQRLGKGTFGSVYRAKRPRLDDTYAIKVINLQSSQFATDGPSLQDRVEREVRILSSISSPHIVKFHDFLELHGGSVGVVMDYVDGKTLGEILADEEHLEVSRSIQFAIEVATGLREVHQRGVVHRDLKPDNVMVQELGRRREFVEIIDFGVAHFRDDVSRTVGFIGTPRYTSPEQARGDDVQNTSDIYTLGMLIFHMVVGQPPFTHKKVNDLLKAHNVEQAPRMSATAKGRKIPPELDALVQSMMAKKPEERPPNMDAVIGKLKEIKTSLERAKTKSTNRKTSTGDSFPPVFDTDYPNVAEASHDDGTLHRTGNYRSLKARRNKSSEKTREGDFTERPPSDVYAVSSEGSIVFCDEDNKLKVRRSTEDKEETVLVTLANPITSIAADTPGWILIGQEDGVISRLSIESADIEPVFEDDSLGAVLAVAETPIGDRVIAGFEEGEVRFGYRDANQRDWQSLPAGEPVISVAIHRDGSCLAVAREDKTTDVYIPSRSTEEPCSLIEHDDIPESIDFSPDGYLIAVRYAKGNIRLYSALTGSYVSDSPRSALQPSSVFEDTDH